jgi:RES domain-containing protein
MLVFRITLTKWADSLRASGYPGRWNSKGYFVIYTAGSQALACLENLVHRSGEGLNHSFRLIEIDIPEFIEVQNLDFSEFPVDWTGVQNYPITQKIGDNWVENRESCVLKVPSAIIPREFNYLINPNHSDFNEIKIKNIFPFEFDSRFRSL